MSFTCGWVGFADGNEKLHHALDGIARDNRALGDDAKSAYELDRCYGIAVSGCDFDICKNAGVVALLVGQTQASGSQPPMTAERLLDTYIKRGESAVQSIYGTYVSIIVDTNSQICIVSTDRFSTTPVYYHFFNGGVAFSSRLGVLNELIDGGRALDLQSIYNYVFFHCIPSPRTIYTGISKLEPARSLILRERGVSSESYWNPEFRESRLSPNETDSAASDLRQAFRSSVEDAVAGKKPGAFLSGGLDSSTVAGMLKTVAGSAATFTVGFDEPQYDESRFAKTSSRHFGTDHHEIVLTPSVVKEALFKITNYLEEPFGNSSVIPTYYCAELARESGVETLLAGDGGDELFAGNTRYVEHAVFDRYDSVPSSVKYVLEKAYALAPILKSLPVSRRGFGYISKAKMGLPDRLQAYNFLSQFAPESVFDAGLLASADQNEPWLQWRKRYNEPSGGSPLQRMLYLDWKFTLADNDLIKVSNMCSLAGVEVRYPMLDQRVVDASLQLDSQGLLLNGDLRGFYKYAWRDFLPESVFTKSKHGFGLPFGVWMRKDPALRKIVSDALDSMRTRNIFNPQFIDTALRMHDTDSPGYYGELVWIIMILELWLSAHA
ncbi:MAG: asparagine synthase (glutamine-hydrolyzing) [Gammaproteobacteria bacterium]|jgi:asparagine synthase (glutamine-hydrolysing)